MSREEEAAREAVRTAVDRTAFDDLETFVAACREWGRVTNLVSAEDRDRLWQRHVLDSLQLLPLSDGAGPDWIDLGSGGGFPGLVVAIARRDTRMTLVESNRKKASFLLHAAGRSGASVRVEARRIEALAPKPHDVVSARALAPLDRLLDLSARFFGEDTVGLFPKGRDADKEVAMARTRFTFHHTLTSSRTDPSAAIVSITDLGRD